MEEKNIYWGMGKDVYIYWDEEEKNSYWDEEKINKSRVKLICSRVEEKNIYQDMEKYSYLLRRGRKK